MNIPGVDVLYTSKYLVDTTWGFSWGIVIFGIVALIGAIGLFIGVVDREISTMFAGSFVLVLGILLLMICWSMGTNIYGTEYNVVINNDVTFSEVASQYKVSTVNGRLYTLRPLEVVPWEGE